MRKDRIVIHMEDPPNGIRHTEYRRGMALVRGTDFPASLFLFPKHRVLSVRIYEWSEYYLYV